MESHLLVRPATEVDADALARLSAILGYPAEVEVMRARVGAVLGSAGDLLLVAEAAGGVVGWLQARVSRALQSAPAVEITGLVVEAAVRRRGVGRRLIAEAERWAREHGAEALVVRSNLRRTESHLFYPALGFGAHKEQAVYRRSLRPSS